MLARLVDIGQPTRLGATGFALCSCALLAILLLLWQSQAITPLILLDIFCTICSNLSRFRDIFLKKFRTKFTYVESPFLVRKYGPILFTTPYTSCPMVKIAVGSTYTLQELTNSLPASVPRKLTIASKSETSILATYR